MPVWPSCQLANEFADGSSGGLRTSLQQKVRRFNVNYTPTSEFFKKPGSRTRNQAILGGAQVKTRQANSTQRI
jgi:hypothetical protein